MARRDLEVRLPRRRFPWLAVAPWVVLVGALATNIVEVTFGDFFQYPLPQALHVTLAYFFGLTSETPILNPTSILMHLALAVFAPVMAIVVLRRVRAFLRLPRGGEVVSVRVGQRGIYVDGALAVSSEDVTLAELATSTEEGLAVHVHTRARTRLTIPVRDEAEGRALVASIARDRDDDSLTFEGVSGPRPRQTAWAIVALAIPVAVLVLSVAECSSVKYPTLSVVMFWAHVFVIAAGGAAAAAAIRPLARRLSSAVRVERAGIRVVGGRFIPYGDIEGVEADDASDVRVALNDERVVRLRFAEDRPLAERDLFIARVRERAGINSGVRVAAANARVAETEEDDVIEATEHAANVGRARRA